MSNFGHFSRFQPTVDASAAMLERFEGSRPLIALVQLGNHFQDPRERGIIVASHVGMVANIFSSIQVFRIPQSH